MKGVTKNKLFFWFIATVLISGFFGWMMASGYLGSLHLRLSNVLYYSSENNSLDDIVIIAIDDKSLARRNASEIGTLQFNKADYAQVLQNLLDAGAKVLGVDVIFSEISEAADQQALVDVLNQNDSIIIAAEPTLSGSNDLGLKPLEVFVEARPENLGSILIKPDQDNTVRRQQVIFSDDQVPLSFDVQIVNRYLDLLPEDSKIVDGGYQLMDFSPRVGQKKFAPITIPYSQPPLLYKDELPDSFLINYFGRPYSYQIISFADAFDNQMLERSSGQHLDLNNKIILIGEMGTGIHDEQYVPTSFGTAMPGVEIHANAIQTLLTQRFLIEQTSQQVLIMIILMVLVSLGLFLFVRLSLSVGLFALSLGGYLISAFVSFSLGVVLNMIYPFLVLLVSFVVAYLYRYVMEVRAQKKTKRAFSRYVSQSLVNKILENPDQLKLGGDKKELTVFFSDIANFTSLSENLKPEKLVSQLNEYLDAMSEIILKSEGTVDKYIGDAIMAFWGAPIPQADHAIRACIAALEYQATLSELNRSWERKKKVTFPARIGINTGELLVGNIGSKNRFDYTVIGDTVNLASRLEGANKLFGTDILISESTYKAAKDHIEVREIDLIAVKGKKKPVRIYELMARSGQLTNKQEKLKEHFEEGLEQYQNQRWKEAIKAFSLALKLAPGDGPAQCYLERCEGYSINPPAKNWDGVFVLKTK